MKQEQNYDRLKKKLEGYSGYWNMQKSAWERALNLQSRSIITLVVFDVDWDVIHRLAADPAYEPCREKRPRDPSPPYQFIEYEDPVLDAVWISGKEARRLRVALSEFMSLMEMSLVDDFLEGRGDFGSDLIPPANN